MPRTPSARRSVSPERLKRWARKSPPPREACRAKNAIRKEKRITRKTQKMGEEESTTKRSLSCQERHPQGEAYHQKDSKDGRGRVHHQEKPVVPRTPSARRSVSPERLKRWARK